MREEYTDYPCSGKKYNGEKAIISLTSWRARINTVSKTLFSLIKQCPGFHIVLVLSEEEFPQMEKELPENLMLFVKNELIELLWVHKNYKAFKKVLFTISKYKNIPVISADDDCLYKCNYAQELYDKWKENEASIVGTSNAKKYKNTFWPNGCCTLFPPFYFMEFGLYCLTDEIISRQLDDDYYAILRDILNLRTFSKIKKSMKDICKFHNEKSPMRDTYTKNRFEEQTIRIYERIIKNKISEYYENNKSAL